MKSLKSVVGMVAFGLVGLSAGVSQAEEAAAFFRQADQGPVYFQYLPNKYCHVQNPDQMEAFGGFAKVKVVPKLAMQGDQTGDCGCGTCCRY